MGASRLPALGSREQLRDQRLENSGKMGSSAFSLLGQYPKDGYTVDFFFLINRIIAILLFCIQMGERPF